jgi:hypothetical protein
MDKDCNFEEESSVGGGGKQSSAEPEYAWPSPVLLPQQLLQLLPTLLIPIDKEDALPSCDCTAFASRLSPPFPTVPLLLALSRREDQATQSTHVDRVRAFARLMRRLLNSRALPLDFQALIFDRRSIAEEVNASHLIRKRISVVNTVRMCLQGCFATRTRHLKKMQARMDFRASLRRCWR